MARTIHSIVEGDGEVEAVALLLRKFTARVNRFDIQVGRPINANGRTNILKPNGLERFCELVRKQADCVGLLILLDTEREDVACPPALASSLTDRVRTLTLPFPVAVVCAVCEYESWFLHNLDRIAPDFDLSEGVYEGDPEAECNAKGWLTARMPPGKIYKETIDQSRMTDRIDMDSTRARSRSFRRFAHAVDELLAAVDQGISLVTPSLA